MNVRSLIKPAPLEFNWTTDDRTGKQKVALPHCDLWGEITPFGDGSCSYSVCNRGTERLNCAQTAQRRVEEWIERIVAARIEDAIRKIETHCIPA